MNTLQIGVVTLRHKNGNMMTTKLGHVHMLVTQYVKHYQTYFNLCYKPPQ
jgi:hypothetical protein